MYYKLSETIYFFLGTYLSGWLDPVWNVFEVLLLAFRRLLARLPDADTLWRTQIRTNNQTAAGREIKNKEPIHPRPLFSSLLRSSSTAKKERRSIPAAVDIARRSPEFNFFNFSSFFFVFAF